MDATDLRLLAALDRLLERGSVTGAARDLGIGQPAMSRTLAQLRERFGDPLLVRAGRAMKLTATAEALRPDVRDLVVRAQRILGTQAPFEPSEAFRVSVAVGDDVASWLLPPLLQAFRVDAPCASLDVRRLDRDALVPLAAGRLDVAVLPDLASIPGVARPDLDHLVVQPLDPVRFVVARRSSEPMDLQTWCAVPHILVAPLGETPTGLVDRLLAEHDLTRRVWVTVPTFEQACRLVHATNAVALLPERVVRSCPFDLTMHPPPLRIPDMPLNMAWAPHLTTSARHGWFRERVIAIARSDREGAPTTDRTSAGTG